ncbi:MAG: PAS domain-containing protein, partial [Coprothermobacterota bacterium]|nr:PAS domain-containing protein [Coprothermobacterota bacterium]
TGSQSEETAAAVMREGADDYILKSNLMRLPSSVRHTLERWETKRALRKSEERWQFALEGAGGGVWEWNPQTGVVYLSPQWKAMLGYGDEEIEAVVGEWERLIHPEDREETRARLEAYLQGRALKYRSEYRLLCKDGSYKWTLSWGKVIRRDAKGRPLRVIGAQSDITERKQAEEEVRISEESFAEAQRIAHLGSWELNLITHQAAWSGEFCRLFEIPAETIGKGSSQLLAAIEERIHPDDRARYQEAVDQCLHKKIPYDIEYRIQLPDGSQRWIHAQGVPTLDQVGNLVRLAGTAMDITERKQAEEALRTSEASYRLLVENANEAIVVAQDGMLKFVNRMASELTGYSEQELTSRPFPEFVYPDDRGMVEERHQSRLKGDLSQPRYAFRLMPRDGSIKWVEIDALLIEWEGKLATLNFLSNITDRKQAEEALRESEASLAEAQRIAHLGNWEWEFISNKVKWSDEMYRIFGLSPDTYDGKPESVLKVVHPDDKERFVKNMEDNFSRGVAHPLEYRVIHPEGAERTLYASGIIVFDEAGNPVKNIGTVQDITERKRQENEITKARANFLFAVSHELKTPLFLMTSAQELLDGLPAEERAGRFLEYEEIWNRNLHRLRHLIDNLVDSQRTEGMGLKLAVVPTDLGEILRQTLKDVDFLTRRQRIRFRLQEDPMPLIPADPESIHRLFENLLTNAIKFSSAGGEVEIDLRPEGEEALFAVRDHGLGIPASEIPQLFQPFQRTDGANRAVIPGTGLGLYTAKLIAEAHGGSIALYSDLGKGTTVVVRLPLHLGKLTYSNGGNR